MELCAQRGIPLLFLQNIMVRDLRVLLYLAHFVYWMSTLRALTHASVLQAHRLQVPRLYPVGPGLHGGQEV